MLIVAVAEVVPINFAFALFTVADKHQNKKNGPKHAKPYQIVAREVQGLCHYYLTSRKQSFFVFMFISSLTSHLCATLSLP